MRRKGQRVFLHRLQQARDGVEHQRCALVATVVEQVDAVFINQAEMHMKTAAGPIAVRLGHEGGGKAMLAGDAPHETLEQHGVVGGLQRVRDMHHVDLELAGAVL